jgi:hypothetical protein
MAILKLMVLRTLVPVSDYADMSIAQYANRLTSE